MLRHHFTCFEKRCLTNRICYQRRPLLCLPFLSNGSFFSLMLFRNRCLAHRYIINSFLFCLFLLNPAILTFHFAWRTKIPIRPETGLINTKMLLFARVDWISRLQKAQNSSASKYLNLLKSSRNIALLEPVDMSSKTNSRAFFYSHLTYNRWPT